MNNIYKTIFLITIYIFSNKISFSQDSIFFNYEIGSRKTFMSIFLNDSIIKEKHLISTANYDSIRNIITFTEFSSSGDTINKKYMFYNEDNQMIMIKRDESFCRYSSCSPNWGTFFSYNDNGKLIEQKDYDMCGYLDISVNMEYDKQNRPSKATFCQQVINTNWDWSKKQTLPDTISIECFKDSNLYSYSCYTTLYEYNGDTTIVLSSDNQVLCYYTSTLNSMGKKDKLVEYDDSLHILKKELRKYNDKGQLIKKTIFTVQGEFKYKAEYEYDCNGFCIKESLYETNQNYPDLIYYYEYNK